MAYYQHILVGLDLSEESRQVVNRVKSISRDGSNDRPRISLIHVQEPLSFAYGGDIPMDLSEVQAQLETRAQNLLTDHAVQLGIPESDRHIIVGQPCQELHRFARDNQVDLIVVGSHGRHGLALVFGSTANGVLHGADCDVLAVRIKDEKREEN